MPISGVGGWEFKAQGFFRGERLGDTGYGLWVMGYGLSKARVSGSGVSSFGFRGSGSGRRFRSSDFAIRGFGFWVSGLWGPGCGFGCVVLGCRVQGSGCKVQGAGFKVQGARCRVQDSGCRVQDSGFRVQGAGCRVQGAGCRVQGAGCRVQGTGCASYAPSERERDHVSPKPKAPNPTPQAPNPNP